MALNLTKDFVFHSIQGEGKYLGYPSTFIRLSGCNLRCEWQTSATKSNLCDTPYSSHYPEKNMHSIDSIIEEVKKYPSEHVVITGGEPFLQEELKDLVADLKKEGRFITIETNGTIYFETEADFISLSPKLSSSCITSSEYYKMHQEKRYNKDALLNFINKHDFQLKFVVNQKEDLNEIKEMLEDLSSKDLSKHVYLMPQGIRKKEIEENSQWIIEEAKSHGYLFSDRLHIRQWGAKRAK